MHNTLRKNLILTDRGRRNLKLERVFHELYDEDRFLNCYGRLYPNNGAMTPGVTPETVDGMSLAKIQQIISTLRDGGFSWLPAKRVYIPKTNGKMRPLGLHGMHTARKANSKIRLEAPMDKIMAYRKKFTEAGKVVHRKDQLANDDYSIVVWFDQAFRGFAEYYGMAVDRAKKLLPLKWVVETSMLKTLANKHRTSVSWVARKYRTWVDAPQGRRRAFRVTVERPGKKPLVATFGGFSLGRDDNRKPITDTITRWWWNSRTELLERMLADKCEYCGKEEMCEVHHIRKVGPLLRKKGLAGWKKLMAIRNRKPLVLCRDCHDKLHAGQLD